MTGQRSDLGNLFEDAPRTAPAMGADPVGKHPDGCFNRAHLDRAKSLRCDDEPLFVDLTCRRCHHRTETPDPRFVRPRTRKCMSIMSAFAAASSGRCGRGEPARACSIRPKKTGRGRGWGKV